MGKKKYGRGKSAAKKRKADKAFEPTLLSCLQKDRGPRLLTVEEFRSQQLSGSNSTPVPRLVWDDQEDMWQNMRIREQRYPKDKDYFIKHPELNPNMRAILFDWLQQVAEAYKFHRETFHLAQDYFDRFMATQTNVLKSKLQLIGITTLFIASKIEEMKPPNTHQFVFITDSACSVSDILDMERVITKSLEWSLSPITAVSWMNLYVQRAYALEYQVVLLPQYPQALYIKLLELLDFCMLDIGCLAYPNSKLAAAAVCHVCSIELAEQISSYKWTELKDCVGWIVPFATAIKEEAAKAKLKFFEDIVLEDMHNIQTHSYNLDLLEKAYPKRTSIEDKASIISPHSAKKWKEG